VCDFDCHTIVSNVQLQQRVIKETDKMLEAIKNVSRTVFSISWPR